MAVKCRVPFSLAWAWCTGLLEWVMFSRMFNGQEFVLEKGGMEDITIAHACMHLDTCTHMHKSMHYMCMFM